MLHFPRLHLCPDQSIALAMRFVYGSLFASPSLVHSSIQFFVIFRSIQSQHHGTVPRPSSSTADDDGDSIELRHSFQSVPLFYRSHDDLIFHVMYTESSRPVIVPSLTRDNCTADEDEESQPRHFIKRRAQSEPRKSLQLMNDDAVLLTPDGGHSSSLIRSCLLL